MAGYEGAVARIRYLAGLGPYQQTPNTINSCGDAPANVIYSYRMPIAWKEDGKWRVESVANSPSRTTDRHIRAAQRALL